MLEPNWIARVLLRHGQRAPHRFRRDVLLACGMGKGDQGIVARNGGNPELLAPERWRHLYRPTARNVSGVGPMKRRPACFDTFGKVGVLGQKAIARIDGVETVLFGKTYNRFNVIVFLNVVHMV